MSKSTIRLPGLLHRSPDTGRNRPRLYRATVGRTALRVRTAASAPARAAISRMEIVSVQSVDSGGSEEGLSDVRASVKVGTASPKNTERASADISPNASRNRQTSKTPGFRLAGHHRQARIMESTTLHQPEGTS